MESELIIQAKEWYRNHCQQLKCLGCDGGPWGDGDMVGAYMEGYDAATRASDSRRCEECNQWNIPRTSEDLCGWCSHLGYQVPPDFHCADFTKRE